MAVNRGRRAAWAATLVMAAATGGCGPEVLSNDYAANGGEAGNEPAELQYVDATQAGHREVKTRQALQTLEGLMAIRQEQCQSGNGLACQSLQQLPPYAQQVTQLAQQCGAGNASACHSFDQLAQQIRTAHDESAAVMRAGAEGMARMNAWRSQMNDNAAASVAALEAQGAAGQAAHNARQQQYAQMNQTWEAGQASIDRNHGRAVDRIYEGTTMSGGGVQSRIPYGSTGYTDGAGNVVAVPNGGSPPPGYQQMRPTYAAPR